jgi:hypothetical protein
MKSLIITFTMSEGLVKVAPFIRISDARRRIQKYMTSQIRYILRAVYYNVQKPFYH